EQLVRVGQRLDRVLGSLERVLGNKHLLGRVLGRPRMVLDRRLELRDDSRLVEDRLQLLGLGDVLGERDLHELGHGTASSRSGSATSSRPWRTAALTRRGAPRSGNGTSITSKSFGTTVSGKIVRASRSTSGPK